MTDHELSEDEHRALKEPPTREEYDDAKQEMAAIVIGIIAFISISVLVWKFGYLLQ